MAVATAGSIAQDAIDTFIEICLENRHEIKWKKARGLFGMGPAP